MMRRVGVHVTADDVRIVLVERGIVRWTSRASIADGATLDEVFGRLLDEMPRRRAMRRHVAVAVDVPFCRVRQLEGLPESTSADALTEVVRANVDRFFPRMAGGVVIPRVSIAPDGRVYGAVLSRDAQQRLASIVSDAGWTLSAVAPAMSVLESCAAGAATHRRTASECAALDGLDAEWHDAYVAAIDGRNRPLAYVTTPPFALAAFARRLLSGFVAMVALSTAMAAVGAPALRAAWTMRRSAPRTVHVAPGAEREAAQLDAELRRGRAVLGAANHLRASQRAISALLADLSEALPESTAIVTLHIDSLEGRFVAVAPSVVDVLPALVGVRGIANPRITGAVTQEMTAGLALERAMLRFGRTGASAAKGASR